MEADEDFDHHGQGMTERTDRTDRTLRAEEINTTAVDDSVGEYEEPSRVMADRSQLEMNQNNLNEMRDRKIVVQAHNKLLVLYN